MTYETLQYTDAGGDQQEVALQSLSPNGAALKHWLEPRSHTWSDYHIMLPQPPETAIAIPFLSQCKVWGCRQSATGANNSFSGGQILFQGRQWENPARASARSVSNEIVLSDALRDLKMITYQIPWQYISGGTTIDPEYSIFDFPDVVLFDGSYNLGLLQPDGTYAAYNPIPQNGLITTWQQIQGIVNFALFYLRGIANAMQLQLAGAPEFTPTYCPIYTARAEKCLDALTICLRPHPLVYTEMDYTTAPPTLHFRYVSNMTPITLPYKGTDASGNVHIATDITPIPELIPARVALFYAVKSERNGQSVISYASDIYPVNAGPALLEEVFSIDLKGPSTQIVSKNFTSYPFLPTGLDLWREKVPSLKEQSDGGQIPNDGQTGALAFVDANNYDATAHPKGIQVIDHNGNPIDYEETYLYFTNEAVYDWFQVNGASALAEKATVKAFFSYQRATTIGAGANATDLTPKILEHEHSLRLMLTDAPSDTYTLSQLINTGEAQPVGLAQTVYTELQKLQYKISPHENWQVGANANTVPQIIKPGKNTINFNGGLTAWETMDAIPESVKIEFVRVQVNGIWLLAAKHTISCGPVNHLSPEYRTQLFNLFSNRNIRHINANERLSGLIAGSGATTDLTADDARENAVPSPELPSVDNIASVDTATGIVTALKIDASQIFAISQLNAGGA